MFECCKDVNPIRKMKTLCGLSDSEPDNDENERAPDFENIDDNDDKLLLLGDELNELSNEARETIPSTDKTLIQLDVPKIVVMGSQSSGKSSFLNCLIKYDLMPTGHQMITKNPVYVRMYKIKKEQNLDECAKISTYEHDVLTTHKTILLSSENYKKMFKDEFERITTKIVGKWENISTKPIYVDIYSYKVSNLALVDLPGIIAVPKTDKGQSFTLVEDIKSLVESEITKKNTYVVLCIEARPDIETDIGLSTFREIKKQNPGLKAVTLFTKLDMLVGDRLSQFQSTLKDGLSKDLQTDDGYYCISAKYDLPNWYYGHLGGSSSVIFKNRLYGINNFFIFLKRKIIGSMKRSFNKLKENMGEFIKNINSLNPQLSENLRNTGEKMTFITHNIYILSRAISNSFNAIGHDNNVAYNFKVVFGKYAQNISDLDPFSTENLSDEKLKSVMDNFDGYLPSTKITATSVINKCLTDRDVLPMKLIVNASTSCIQQIGVIILNLVKKFLEMDKLDIHQLELNSPSVPIYQFPNLKEFILKTTTDLIKTYEDEAMKVIRDYILIQEKQVWVSKKDLDKMYDTNVSLESKFNENNNSLSMITDDDDKINYDAYLKDTTDPSNKLKDDNIADFEINPNNHRALVEMRFLTKVIFRRIASSTQSVAVKTIIRTLIKKIENHFFLELIKKINEVDDINNYFYDSDEKVQQNYKVETILAKANRLYSSIRNFDFY